MRATLEVFAKASEAVALRAKSPFLAFLKRGAKVFTAIIPNAKTETLLPIIQERVEPDSIVYTDTFRSYDALDVSDFHHSRVNHSELFADQRNHINGIENFWNQSKRHWPPVQRHQTGELLLVSQGV